VKGGFVKTGLLAGGFTCGIHVWDELLFLGFLSERDTVAIKEGSQIFSYRVNSSEF
jgi:hypothetical protein